MLRHSNFYLVSVINFLILGSLKENKFQNYIHYFLVLLVKYSIK